MTDSTAIETTVYSQQGATALALDVFPPTSDSNHVAVLVVHGGAWRLGSKEDVHERAAALSAAGFTAVTVQYRLADTAPWPAALTDVAAALAWIRTHAADLDVDPARVVVQGHSAGGHIALMTGTLDATERPAAIVAFYPPIGFHIAPPPTGAPSASPMAIPTIQLDDLGRVPGWMLFPPNATQTDLDEASPIDLADEHFPPTIIFHGTADAMINYRSSVALHERLLELGVPTELHTFTGRDHEFDQAPSMTQATVTTTTSFLDRTVIHREESEAEARRYTLTLPPPDLP